MDNQNNQQQQRLFNETFEDALDEVIKTFGDGNGRGGRKAFAAHMWPTKPPREAHNLIDACLNPERREKFSPHDVRYILKRGREIGCHAGLFYLVDDVGYSRPQPITPADRAAELQRDIVQTVQRVERMVQDLKDLARSPLAVINGGQK